jgi:hypothetical protein
MRIEKPIGKYSENQARKYLKIGFLFFVPYIALFLTTIKELPFYIDLGYYDTPRGMILGVLVTLGAVYAALPYQTYKSGLNGERKVVNNISNKLGSDHVLFNDVMLKDGQRSGNIDHIIIGPRGIFALETKNVQNALTVNGDDWKGVRRSPSLQAKNHAKRIYRLLKNSSNILEGQIPIVKAVVVLTNSKAQLVVGKEPERCKIIQLRNEADTSLYDYIMKQDVLFSTQEIEAIVDSLKSNIYY